MNRMNQLSPKIAMAAIVGAGLLFALEAYAAWSPAPANPPANNAPAPINVGPSLQFKSGPLGIGASSTIPSGALFDVFGIGIIADLFSNTVSTNQLAVLGGSPGTGKVLTSDAAGNATWQVPQGGGGGSAVSASSVTFSPIPSSMSANDRASYNGDRIFIGKHTFCALSGLTNNFSTSENTYIVVKKAPSSPLLFGYGAEDLSRQRTGLPGEWYMQTDHVTSDMAATCLDIVSGGTVL